MKRQSWSAFNSSKTNTLQLWRRGSLVEVAFCFDFFFPTGLFVSFQSFLVFFFTKGVQGWKKVSRLFFFIFQVLGDWKSRGKPKREGLGLFVFQNVGIGVLGFESTFPLVRRILPPRTWHQSGYRIVLPEYERFHACCLVKVAFSRLNHKWPTLVLRQLVFKSDASLCESLWILSNPGRNAGENTISADGVNTNTFRNSKGLFYFPFEKGEHKQKMEFEKPLLLHFFFFKNQQVKRVVAALKQCKRLALRVNCSAKMCSQFLRRRFSLLLRCCSFLILILLPVFSSSLFFDFLFTILYLLGLWLFAVCSLPWEVDVGWPAWQWKKKKDLQSVLY